MTFFKLFYTTDTQNTRLTHRTTLENKNINTHKKFTGKTRKNTPRPADNEKQHGRKHKTPSLKKGCSFQTYETLLFAPRATRRGNKILILFYIYFGFGTLVFGYRKTPLAENKKYVPCILKYVRCISKYVRPIFRGIKPRVYWTFGAEGFA